MLITVSLFVLFVRVHRIVADSKNVTKIIKKYDPVVLNTKIHLPAESKVNVISVGMTKKKRSAEEDTAKKDTFIEQIEYKLIYVYGSNPLKHFFNFFLKSVIFFGFIVYFMKFGFFLTIVIVSLLSVWGAVILTNHAFDQKIAQFLDNFVYAMDSIVRGVRSGLALNVCFKQITENAKPVVAEQFMMLLDDFKKGMTAEQALDRFMERLPLKEVTFFCLSVITQAKTGGNLAEIIDGLAKILKNRKSLLVKIKTLSSEAKSSAVIMGAMPVFVVGVLTLISYDYIKILFETQMGNYVLFGCGMWMGIGALIMRKMINFYK